MLLVDLKGVLQNLPIEGDLYESSAPKGDEVQWPKEKVDVVVAPKAEKNEFLNNLNCEENAMDTDQSVGKYDTIENF